MLGARAAGGTLHMMVRHVLAVVLVCAAAFRPGVTSSEPVAVRHMEGLVHGFLALRSSDGKTLASGDLIQEARGDRVTSRLVYHFKDGSINDETAVFSQRGHFRLLSNHLVQKGPAFDRAIDMTIDAQSGQVTVLYQDDHGEQKTEAERLELPPDLANGMIITLLKNVRRGAVPKSVGYVA